MKSGADLITEAKTRIREVSAADVQRMLADGANAIYLDVREPDEYDRGHLPGALFIPRGTLEGRVERAIARHATVVIYCAAGNRSALAADTMQQMGYTDVCSMAGGWRDWVALAGPVDG